MPSQQIVAAAAATVRSYPDRQSFHVLDLSCGDGELLGVLAAAGCRVEGTHFRSDDYIYKCPSPVLETATIHDGIDLSRPLPFPDARYDVVIATEVFEHLPSHGLPCSEAARILKPGGIFILSTPNIHRLASRLQFLLTGQHELRSARIGWEVPAANLYSTHHNPVYFPTLHTLLYQHGLRVRKLLFTKAKPWTWLLAGLYPVIAAATVIETRHALKRSRCGGKDLLRWMLDWRMLFSDNLMLVAEKNAPTTDGAAT